MFDAIGKTIDPYTGKPYSFGLDGTNDTSQHPWTTLDPTASLTAGDQDPNNRGLGGIGFTPEFLQAIGYTGADPMSYRQGENQGVDPAFVQFLQDIVLKLGYNTTPRTERGGYGTQYLGAFDANGDQVAQQTGSTDDGSTGALIGATLLAGGFGAATAAGLGGAAAGGAGTTGGSGAGLSAEQLAYGALENGAAYGGGAGDTLLASAGAGLPEGALGAGEVAAGAGGSSAAADAAAMGLAEGAYPAGLGGYGGAASGGGGLLSSLGSAASDASTWMGNNKLLTSVGGGLLNTGIGYLASQNALKQQTDATNKANALLQPYSDLGTAGVTGYKNLLANPGSVVNDPGYAFARDQGQQAIDRRAAAGGGMYSGAQMKAASRFNSDYASTALDKALARYGSAAQIGATGTIPASQNVTNLGNAAGSASLYTGNLATGGVNNALATLNNSSYATPGSDWWKRNYGTGG